MDGRNSLGRRISLLNESEGPAYTSYRSGCSSRSGSSNHIPSFASYPRSAHSRTSSYASTPVLSPQTPPLSRSNSSDSADSRIMQIPSPITPDFAFDAQFPPVGHVPSPEMPQKQSFFPPLPKDGQNMAYGALPTQMGAPFAYPAPPLPASAQQQPFMPTSAPMLQPDSPGKAAEPRAGSSSKPQSKKNQYPCPLARQYNCPDYFTTSGHAARHAKKHTGRKDAICPECNKAFTRKDNMEQHRRTHQSGRNTQKSSDDSASSKRPAKAPSQPPANKRPKPSPLQTQAVTPVVDHQPLIDPMLSTSPGSSLAFSDAASLVNGPLQPLTAFTSPYVEPEPYRYDQIPGGFTAGLDTLAIVATDVERKRKHDE